MLRRGRWWPWIGFASSAFDVSMVSTALVTFLIVGSPMLALNSNVTFEMYFLAMVATSLRYDARICIVAGLLAGGEYGGLWAWAATHYDLHDPVYVSRRRALSPGRPDHPPDPPRYRHAPRRHHRAAGPAAALSRLARPAYRPLQSGPLRPRPRRRNGRRGPRPASRFPLRSSTSTTSRRSTTSTGMPWETSPWSRSPSPWSARCGAPTSWRATAARSS